MNECQDLGLREDSEVVLCCGTFVLSHRASYGTHFIEDWYFIRWALKFVLRPNNVSSKAFVANTL